MQVLEAGIYLYKCEGAAGAAGTPAYIPAFPNICSTVQKCRRTDTFPNSSLLAVLLFGFCIQRISLR